MSRFSKVIAILCMALLVGACGSTTKTAAPGSSPSDTASPTPTATDTALQAGGGSDCGFGRNLAESRAAAAAAASKSLADLKSSLEKAREALDKIVDLVPAELKADARIVVNGYKAYYDVFAQYGYNFRTIPPQRMILAAQALSAANFTAAAKKVFGYFATHCGIANPYGG